MTLLSPSRLWLLALVVGLAVAYVVIQVRGRRRYAVRFSNLSLLGALAPKRPGWRRHLPAALLLASLVAMVVSLARPARDERVPRERATVVLAIDVSISMEATDVAPDRITAAKNAAVAFSEDLPLAVNLGLVSFAGRARVLISPTTDHDAVAAAVERLRLEERTAIGDAVEAALDAVESVLPAPGEEPVPAAVVLMSDGETTTGTPTARAADTAERAGVPVSTIAFGTPGGTITYQGEVVPVPVNQEELAYLAETTGGETFSADTGEELRSVYADIGSSIGYETEQREIGTWFIGSALALALAASAGSLLWGARLP